MAHNVCHAPKVCIEDAICVSYIIRFCWRRTAADAVIFSPLCEASSAENRYYR